MNLITGKDPIFEVENYDVVLLGASVMCQISRAGFAAKMLNKYPVLQKEDDKQTFNDHRRLGTRLTFSLHEGLTVSLLYIGYSTRFSTIAPFMKMDYNALERCLRTANAEFKGKKVITNVVGTDPYIGSGDKTKCLDLIERCTPNLNIDVYDYPDERLANVRQSILDQIKNRCGDDKKLLRAALNRKKLSTLYKKLYLIPLTNKTED